MFGNFVWDFRKFIARGNVIDLAVGVVVGTAFSAITTSLVNDIIMPPIGLIIGGDDFNNLGIILQNADRYPSVTAAVEAGEAVLLWGRFVNTVINFLIISLVMFSVIRTVNTVQDLREQEEADPDSPAQPPREVKLLEEIRDLLAEGKN